MPSDFTASIAIMETVKMAGWVMSVRVSRSSGPLNRMSARSNPSTELALSSTALAASGSFGERLAHAHVLRALAGEEKDAVRHNLFSAVDI